MPSKPNPQFAPSDLGEFTATAYGPPWNAMNGTGVTSQGTDLRGAKGVGKYIVAADPNVIPYGTRLTIDPNPFGNPNIVFLMDDTGGAFQGGVKKIDIFDWRGRSHQMRWGSRQVKVSKTLAASGSVVQSQSGLDAFGNAVGDVTGAVGDVIADPLEFLRDLIATILNFRKFGELLAKVFAWFIRLVFRALWDYVFAPLVHWNQRAVVYYYETYFGDDPDNKRAGSLYYQNAGVITLSFWALGYGILWYKAEPNVKFGAEPRESMLGKFIRSTEGQAARRHVVKAEKVDEQTPEKPEPVKSSVKITRTRELATLRKRPVQVKGTGVNEPTTGTRRNGRSHEIPRPGGLPANHPAYNLPVRK